MITIHNTEEFIKALKLSHQSGERAFQQFTNFLERFSQENNLEIYNIIGGSEKFLGWSHNNIHGGLLFDNDGWSSHT